MRLPSYVLITPARNEARYIKLALDSLVRQKLRPLKWVIVSDGSTDGTDELVAKYAAEHDWIELVRLPEGRERHFAAKVEAFNAGYARVAGLGFDVIGNLDGDVSIEDESHFEFLMGKFAENPSLGVAGTGYREGGVVYPYRFTSMEDVAGACQLFRRECFEAIGGYPPLRSGGIDVVTVFSAQAKGWQTKTFVEKTFIHHRPVGSAQHTSFVPKLFGEGGKDYRLGSHPVWELFRSVYKMKDRPYIIGGLLILSGYFWAMLRNVKRIIPEELMERRRDEQMRRLKGVLRRASFDF